ncbi:MAG: LysR family transcriptional regulator [Eubacterium sp.]|nr:LysR family transcriptional regulator [Eubacterium sp.]
MNVLHMKYAVEVAKEGSINKASEKLLIAQPNLSRSIKELEADLGISIFARSSKGMTLTAEGEEFINYAKKILHQIYEIEMIYKTGKPAKQMFSISVPRASYIADAFAKFSNSLEDKSSSVFYNETNNDMVIRNILENDYKLGIVRYASNFDRNFKIMFEEKGLSHEFVSEFKYVLIMNKNSDLAKKDSIQLNDLADYVEIAHADPYVPTLPVSTVMKEEMVDVSDKRIYVFERGSQFDLLVNNHRTFMWVSPLPDNMLERYDLVQKACVDNTKVYKDVLIYKNDYKMTKLDKQFISELIESRRKTL